jgi:Flp pilus assembly protein TadG
MLNFSKRCKDFAADQNGTLAVYLGIAAVPLLLAAGTAIDMGRYNLAVTHVQSALDTATLSAAVGKGIPDDDRIVTAQASFDNNMKAVGIQNLLVKPDFKIVDDKVRGTAALELPTTFMSLAGIAEMKSTSVAEVSIQPDRKAEIVLVLDYSWSMTKTAGGEVKYEGMKKAATKLVEDLAKADPKNVKFGLVPFSHHVYTTLPSAYVLKGAGKTWTGCTQDRKHDYNTMASTPTTDDASKWNQVMYSDPDDDKNEQFNLGCDGYKDNKLKTMDLTNKFDDVTSKLADMKPYAYTHIALGVEFGYHMLSPNAPFTQGADFKDANTKKFMVVLTDGEQTTGGFGPSDVRTTDQGEKNLEALCKNAKGDGITMITMAFDLKDTDTRNRLQGCATDPDTDFFVADDTEALATAFDQVKEALTAQIYLSK